MASHPGLLVGMLDIVLNKEVKALEMEDFRLRDDFEIWPLVLKKCTGLERWVIARFRTVLFVWTQKTVFTWICSAVLTVFTERKTALTSDDPNPSWCPCLDVCREQIVYCYCNTVTAQNMSYWRHLLSLDFFFHLIHKVQERSFTFMGHCIFNVFEQNQQDATLHNGIYFYKCSTSFRQFLRPSSGAQNCIHSIGYLLSCNYTVQ